MSIRRIISIPPNYFYGCVLFCIPFYFVPEKLQFITFPYNLLGIILLPIGLYLVINPWYLFKTHATPEDFSESTALVTEGIYKYSRNPMYLGGVLFFVGLAVTTGNLLALLMPLIFFLIMHCMFIPFEEDRMKKTFGEDYMDYTESVRRWI